jgi:hypothetical protein
MMLWRDGIPFRFGNGILPGTSYVYFRESSGRTIPVRAQSRLVGLDPLIFAALAIAFTEARQYSD